MRVQASLIAGLLVASAPASAEEFLVHSQAEYAAAASKVRAGDAIVLADGEWRDFEIVLSGRGTAERPIALRAQSAGKVVLTGRSNLRIGGQFVVVSDLVFRDGYSPTGEVLSYRTSKDDLAHDSRMTGIVIDGFSKPGRYDDDYWISMYGRNNRFDHGYVAGKTNKGVTLAVRLDSEGSRQNGHRIDHNYFGKRPVLGSNGGETIRVGTSQFSMHDSGTVIENNYFEECDGEVEIVSIKSGRNVVRENVFDASQGAVTLRHGDGNLVERNVFLGRGKPHTGGIRVINRDQTVRGNYMEGLRGTGFASALAIMNGVPDSPVHRYVQVTNAVIENNSILDSTRIALAAGADAERSAPPTASRVANNLLSGEGDRLFVTVDDDVSGIAFAGNIVVAGPAPAALPQFDRRKVALKRAENGLLYPVGKETPNLGAPRDLKPVTRAEVGPGWYPKPVPAVEETSRTVRVSAGPAALERAISNAQPGDVIELAPGRYLVEKTLVVNRDVSVVGAAGPNDAVIAFARPSLFEIADGVALRLANLAITGEEAPDNVGNAVIRTSATPVRGNFTLELDRVAVRDLNVNRAFDVVVVGKSAFADSIVVRNSSFSNITGAVIRADAESDDFGQYGVEFVTVSKSNFSNVGGGVAVLYRGGRDESTFGPHFAMTGSQISGSGKAGADQPAVHLHGVQETQVSGNTFSASGPIRVVHTVGVPDTVITGNTFDTAAPIEVIELEHRGAPRADTSGNLLPTDGRK